MVKALPYIVNHYFIGRRVNWRICGAKRLLLMKTVVVLDEFLNVLFPPFWIFWTIEKQLHVRKAISSRLASRSRCSWFIWLKPAMYFTRQHPSIKHSPLRHVAENMNNKFSVNL